MPDTPQDSSQSKPATLSWRATLSIYLRPQVMMMLFLGFSAGLPFLLVFSTLSAWLTEEGVSRASIGYFSWVGILYSIKIIWAPVVDQTHFPGLTRFGRRRSWLIFAQTLIGLGLLALSMTEPSLQLSWVAVFALVVAFGSATQDIVIDALRIEAGRSVMEGNLAQGAMSASYIFGYRAAILYTGAGALYFAEWFNWTITYQLMAATTLIGLFTTWVIQEPKDSRAANSERARLSLQQVPEFFKTYVLEPFIDFFKVHGRWALMLLLFISIYRLSDITMGVMANPFYLDMGYSKSEIASVSKIYGLVMTLVGAALGGALVVKWGLFKPLLLGAVLVASTNVLFAWLALQTPEIDYLIFVIAADNLSQGLATSAFIAYLSSLTNVQYTATQYALFSSLMTLPGKFLGGFSGEIVEAFGYSPFFIYSSLLGIPAIVITLLLIRQSTKQ